MSRTPSPPRALRGRRAWPTVIGIAVVVVAAAEILRFGMGTLASPWLFNRPAVGLVQIPGLIGQLGAEARLFVFMLALNVAAFVAAWLLLYAGICLLCRDLQTGAKLSVLWARVKITYAALASLLGTAVLHARVDAITTPPVLGGDQWPVGDTLVSAGGLVVLLLSRVVFPLFLLFWFRWSRISVQINSCGRPGACPQCGYDLRATAEPRCPECGRGASGDSAPDRVPRRLPP